MLRNLARVHRNRHLHLSKCSKILPPLHTHVHQTLTHTEESGKQPQQETNSKNQETARERPRTRQPNPETCGPKLHAEVGVLNDTFQFPDSPSSIYTDRVRGPETPSRILTIGILHPTVPILVDSSLWSVHEYARAFVQIRRW